MERHQLERREKIAAGIVLAVIATKTALYAQKEGKLGHARDYPAGSFIIEVLKDAKEKSIRISGLIKNLNPLKLEIDDVEHSDAELDEIEHVFDVTYAEE